MARFLNAMARSIGVRDNYPFIIAPPVLEKLRFVQCVLQRATTTAGNPVPNHAPDPDPHPQDSNMDSRDLLNADHPAARAPAGA